MWRGYEQERNNVQAVGRGMEYQDGGRVVVEVTIRQEPIQYRGPFVGNIQRFGIKCLPVLFHPVEPSISPSPGACHPLNNSRQQRTNFLPRLQFTQVYSLSMHTRVKREKYIDTFAFVYNKVFFFCQMNIRNEIGGGTIHSYDQFFFLSPSILEIPNSLQSSKVITTVTIVFIFLSNASSTCMKGKLKHRHRNAALKKLPHGKRVLALVGRRDSLSLSLSLSPSFSFRWRA